MTEQGLKAGLARLAAPVVPAEDPYGRLMRRRRRSQRNRLAGFGSALVAALVAVLLSPLAQPGAAPSPNPTPSGGENPGPHVEAREITPWVRRLIESPVRGSLAGDTAYLAELTAKVAEHDTYNMKGQDKVLFVGDVGKQRIAIVARYNDHEQYSLTMIGPRGIGAAELAKQRREEPDGTATIGIWLTPFFVATVLDYNHLDMPYASVALAPAGCRIASADPAAATVEWLDEPTGDYLVSTQAHRVHRVTCDGQVRYQGVGDGPGMTTPRRFTQAELDAAAHGVRGDGDPAKTAETVQEADLHDAVAPPKLLYLGRMPGAPADDPVLGIVQVQARDGWRVSVNEDGKNASIRSQKVLGSQDAIIAVEYWRYPGEFDLEATPRGGGGQVLGADGRMFVLAPPTAVTVQVLRADDTVLRSAPLVGGAGSLDYKVGQTLRLRAVDASGHEVASGIGPLPTVRDPEYKFADTVDDWS
ncbi:hypothetical protein [Catellatospora tritici]|uniref:hypothetical protein n=1 Tax=Catellatospora tritici TaxID=2851566 RepID=UPI001C2D4FEC|nr:hypothetical protein [Catellatospora tritici]MBV1848754.1 hypothetical protein [Catellatospora tritici]